MTRAIIVIVGGGGILKSSKYLFTKYEGTETMHQNTMKCWRQISAAL